MRAPRFIGLCALLVFSAAAQEQPPKPPPPWPLLETLPLLKQSDPAAPLVALIHLRENKQRALDDPNSASMYFDLLASVDSFVGEHGAALKAETESLARSAPRDQRPVDLAGYRAQPADAGIIEACRDRRIVMLNEEHRLSLQRAFLTDLLPALRREGFTHLAIEALSEDDRSLQTRGYAVSDTGLYTMDPQFAEAIRLAISLGMQVVRYEPDAKEIGPEPGDRDRRSAKALTALLEQDPGTRLLVYAGRYHIAKRGDSTWTPLAARLKEGTGIEPLCIDLIALREYAREEDEHPAFRAAINAGLLGHVPVLFVDASGHRYSHWPDQIDFSVCFPRTTLREGRPDWLFRGRRRAAPIADHLPALTAPTLVRADRPGELPGAIPADQIIVDPGRPIPVLLLPPGRFHVAALGADGTKLAEFDLTVDP